MTAEDYEQEMERRALHTQDIIKERDAARDIARRLARSIIECEVPPSWAQADALLIFDALPWAKDD